MISLNDVTLPTPSSLKVSVSPGRRQVRYNSLGEKLLDGQYEKTTVEISWARMDSTALASLAQLLQSDVFFTLVYPDPLSGQRQITCHVVGRTAQVFSLRGTSPAFSALTLKLEER